jgi:GxxExxY protein
MDIENDPLTERIIGCAIEPVFVAQMLTYLRLTKLKRGLILNFDRAVLKAGIKRVSL